MFQCMLFYLGQTQKFFLLADHLHEKAHKKRNLKNWSLRRFTHWEKFFETRVRLKVVTYLRALEAQLFLRSYV